MHSRFGSRGALLGGLLVLALAVMPSVASAKPEPGVKRSGFRLFARSLGAMTINRIYCGLATTGEVCVDSTNSSTIGGGFWPKGTPDQYVFNSGLQLAGIIGGSKPGNPWGGDTTGAFFFNARGDNVHGQEVQPIYNASNPSDVAAWPEAGLVPKGDNGAAIFDPLLQGLVSASQGDVWSMNWEGDPGTGGGRPHPLGVVVEQRGMGWNYPTGNEDILYFVYTFYNVTSLNPADYAGIRPSMQEILLQKAAQFHALNNAEFGVDLPDGGYEIHDLYAAFGADMDVGSAGENYSTVELPFALGNTYERDFAHLGGWDFDPGIFAPPTFFPGVGFVGVKYLKSPTGPGEIQLFSNTINSSTGFPDPRNTTQLFRYLSGNINTAAGDFPCNTGDPVDTHICYVNNAAKNDMRFFQSSTALTLPPGGSGSIVVAYIFAAPVAVASFTPGGSTDLKPGDPRFFSDVSKLTTPGAINMVDSLAGFLGFNDANGNGVAEQSEYTVVPGSLLGKALVAQSVFDNKFLLPFAPTAPPFFLVPGDNQVTVLWRPSASEATGDPFFSIANSAMIEAPGGGLVVNPLYDPNYRQFDVEGYRVYRGRVDAPNSLSLLAQFDYAGTTISDFSGFVNPVPTCAPELAIFTDCPAPYNPAEFTPGVTRTISAEVPLVGTVVQVKTGARAELADGTATILPQKADTAVTGAGSGFPALSDNGVPFVYVDRTVRNNFRYFYAVTAFDVNSFASGLSSIESARITKSTTPRVSGTNFASTGEKTGTALLGRGQVLNSSASEPTIDPATGEFSGPFPPANAWSIDLGAVVSEVLNGGVTISAKLDSIGLGSPYDGTPHTYYFTAGTGAHFAAAITQQVEIGVEGDTANFRAVPPDNARAALFGGNSSFLLPGAVGLLLGGSDYAGLYGRGCVNARDGFGDGTACEYNGSRWFAGPSPANNETQADPIAGNTTNFGSVPMTNYNNAGALPGVVTIFQGQAYQSLHSTWRSVQGVFAGAHRAADFNVYWGAAGRIDSVVDITHNVLVPGPADSTVIKSSTGADSTISLGFDKHFGGTWGILNPGAALPAAQSADASTNLTVADIQCVDPLFTLQTGPYTCDPTGTPYELSATAVPGSIGFFSGGQSADPSANVTAANAGFGMYIAGDFFMFELQGGAVPAAGTVWSLRQYIGAISGGNGAAGSKGPYAFSNPEEIRPLTAVGAELTASYTVSNVTAAPTLADLDRVHTVPDPYYITNELEQSTDVKVLKFVNLPSACTIRIYSASGVLVDVIEHNSASSEGTETWDLQNRNHQVVASGVYFYHIEAGDARRVGRFTVVNFAQ